MLQILIAGKENFVPSHDRDVVNENGGVNSELISEFIKQESKIRNYRDYLYNYKLIKFYNDMYNDDKEFSLAIQDGHSLNPYEKGGETLDEIDKCLLYQCEEDEVVYNLAVLHIYMKLKYGHLV